MLDTSFHLKIEQKYDSIKQKINKINTKFYNIYLQHDGNKKFG